MKKDIERLLDLLTLAGIAAAALFALWRFIETKLDPARFAVQSAPWYTDVVIIGGAALIVAVVAQIAKFFWKGR